MKLSMNPGELYALDGVLQAFLASNEAAIPIQSVALKVKKAIERLPELYPELAADAST